MNSLFLMLILYGKLEDLHGKTKKKGNVQEKRDKRSRHKRVQICKFIGFVVWVEIYCQEEKL